MPYENLAPLWTTWATQNHKILEFAEYSKAVHLSDTGRSSREWTEFYDSVDPSSS